MNNNNLKIVNFIIRSLEACIFIFAFIITIIILVFNFYFSEISCFYSVSIFYHTYAFIVLYLIQWLAILLLNCLLSLFMDLGFIMYISSDIYVGFDILDRLFSSFKVGAPFAHGFKCINSYSLPSKLYIHSNIDNIGFYSASFPFFPNISIWISRNMEESNFLLLICNQSVNHLPHNLLRLD